MDSPMRELIEFACAGETLIGTLDRAEGQHGVLIVSGGNEIRVGAHRGMAMLAARLAADGTPVFRFDRRGVGDSAGNNGGYASSAPDIAAAVSAFRGAVPGLRLVTGLGNCDAATALVLFGQQAGIDRLILTNPFVVEQGDDLPPAAAIKARYAERLRDPAEWRRLLKGGVNLRKLFSGLTKIARARSQGSASLAATVFNALPAGARVILAERDTTAQAFAAEARQRRWQGQIDLVDSPSHSFAREGDADQLLALIRAAL